MLSKLVFKVHIFSIGRTIDLILAELILVLVHDGIRTNLPQYKNTLEAFQNIFHTEGIRGLYRGAFVATVGTTASWSIYMAVYV
jgi:hypothetical protein